VCVWVCVCVRERQIQRQLFCANRIANKEGLPSISYVIFMGVYVYVRVRVWVWMCVCVRER